MQRSPIQLRNRGNNRGNRGGIAFEINDDLNNQENQENQPPRYQNPDPGANEHENVPPPNDPHNPQQNNNQDVANQIGMLAQQMQNFMRESRNQQNALQRQFNDFQNRQPRQQPQNQPQQHFQQPVNPLMPNLQPTRGGLANFNAMSQSSSLPNLQMANNASATQVSKMSDHLKSALREVCEEALEAHDMETYAFLSCLHVLFEKNAICLNAPEANVREFFRRANDHGVPRPQEANTYRLFLLNWANDIRPFRSGVQSNQGNANNSNRQGSSNRTGTCTRFNFSTCGAGDSCKYSHTCKVCHERGITNQYHRAKDCNNALPSSSQQPDNQSSQARSSSRNVDQTLASLADLLRASNQ